MMFYDKKKSLSSRKMYIKLIKRNLIFINGSSSGKLVNKATLISSTASALINLTLASPLEQIVSSTSTSLMTSGSHNLIGEVQKTFVVDYDTNYDLNTGASGVMDDALDEDRRVVTSHFFMKYKPETGLRTATILGSMLFLIIFYILWRNRCRCGSSSNKSDLDMEYWLKYVDEQKEAKKNRQLNQAASSHQLPNIRTNPKQATDEWVQKHYSIWNSKLQRKRHDRLLIYNETQNNQGVNCNDDSTTFHFLFRSRLKQSQTTDANLNYSSYFKTILNPLKKRLSLNNVSLANQRTRSQSENKFNLAKSLLNTKRQLLGTNDENENPTNEMLLLSQSRDQSNKLYTSKPFTSSFLLGQANMSSYLIKQQQKHLLMEESHLEDHHLSKLNRFKSKLSTKLNNPFIDINNIIDSLAYENELRKDSGDWKTLNEDDVNQNLKEITQVHILQKIFTNMLVSSKRNRSHSWPRSNVDYLRLNNFNREIRFIYNQRQQKHLIQKKRQQKESAQKLANINNEPKTSKMEVTVI